MLYNVMYSFTQGRFFKPTSDLFLWIRDPTSGMLKNDQIQKSTASHVNFPETEIRAQNLNNYNKYVFHCIVKNGNCREENNNTFYIKKTNKHCLLFLMFCNKLASDQ